MSMSIDGETVFDLCVVGAGLVGSAAARYASQRGEKVCLVGPPEPQKPEDWQTREIFSSHYDEGRITRAWDVEPDLRILNEASIRAYRDLELESGISFHSPVGCLFLGPKGSKMMKRLQSEEGKSGRSNILNLCDRKEFRKKFPYLTCKEDELAYLETGGAGHVSPRRMLEAQQVVAERNVCHLVKEVAEEICFDHLKDKKLLQVVTELGKRIWSRKVLLCTNAFTQMKPGLLPKDKGRLDLRLRRSTAALVMISEEEAARLNTMPSMLYSSNEEDTNAFSHYILPPIKYPNGKWYIKIGGTTDVEEEQWEELTSNEIKEWFSSGGNEHQLERSVQFIKKLLPGLLVDDVEPMNCVMCGTSSGIPYIGAVTSELFVAVGGNGVSAKSSNELGRIASRVATENAWTIGIHQSRFAPQWLESDFPHENVSSVN